jgi:hypothetical protein
LDYLITQAELEALANDMVKPVKREDYKEGNKFLYDRFNQITEQAKKKNSIWQSNNTGPSIAQSGIWGTSPTPTGFTNRGWKPNKR